MRIDGKAYRSAWREDGEHALRIFDQTLFPHAFEVLVLRDAGAVAEAIRTMRTRGAPLIGACGAYGLALALRDDPSDEAMTRAHATLDATRPTAVNLRWALDRVRDGVAALPPGDRADAALALADAICDEDVAINRAIGEHGLALLRAAAARRGGGRVNVLTHCNAGWLATVDWGTATAPIYMAHDAGIDIHVWVDETRPRNQGAALTAWELGRHGVPHTLVADNSGGHLMQHGLVDLCLVGTDRVTRDGDVCNKIGTYLKALAAADNGVPFHVCLPSPTIDWRVADGLREIPIEQRAGREVTHVAGLLADGRRAEVRISPEGTEARNDAFDVTPARLVTGLVTERGICRAERAALRAMFPDLAAAHGD
ncbi:MAG: S-methyl-5-thioribose-1-phosphate isomerase [Alphaproteobacteria bacterium]|nr:S-methyl-5-thioribose-1-phosphate isomerase [Alphaproteobacteria bacterium]